MPRLELLARLLARENEPGAKLVIEKTLLDGLLEKFNSAMDAFSPFEISPQIAVAVSGGSDSMALTLLLNRWARAHGGQIIALTVDHGLRPGSSEDARVVNSWMGKYGINHEVLSWVGSKPRGNLQSIARDARYKLIDDWCRDNHILHVFIGHTADDQEETHLMRLTRKSHFYGLAGMSAVRELSNCRLLRPLLGVKRRDLRNFLGLVDQEWLDDPSNTDNRFTRTQVRNLISSGLLSKQDLKHACSYYGRLRIASERATDQFLAYCSKLSPVGYITINRLKLRNASSDTAIQALGRVIASVGGNRFIPSQRAIKKILKLCYGLSSTSQTLGGCRIAVSDEEIMICREVRNLPNAMTLVSGGSFLWDGRIFIQAGDIPGTQWQISAAAEQTWSKNALDGHEYKNWRALPEPVRKSLPVLIGPMGVCSVPLLAYNGAVVIDINGHKNFDVSMVFQPKRPMSSGSFCIANSV